jgi:hypothetical protein
MTTPKRPRRRSIKAAAKHGDIGAVRSAIADWDGHASDISMSRRLIEAVTGAIDADHAEIAVYLLDVIDAHVKEDRFEWSVGEVMGGFLSTAIFSLRDNPRIARELIRRGAFSDPYWSPQALFLDASTVRRITGNPQTRRVFRQREVTIAPAPRIAAVIREEMAKNEAAA